MNNIILASSSPRRKEICKKYGLNPIIKKPKIKEIINNDENVYQIVMALSFEKANDIAISIKEEDIVIASDTVIYYDGKILGKPSSEEDAFKMLNMLSGVKHKVITGIAIIQANTNNKIIDYVETEVKFKELSEEKIKNYIKRKEYVDKAGSYGIQGYGQLLVDSIKGSYLNVMGFPIEKISDLLESYFNIKML